MNLAALEGDLRHFFAPEILQFLDLARATGRLEFERPGECIEIFLDHGHPVFARTNRGSVKVGELLVHRGAISAESLERALERQRSRPAERLGSLLVANGAASPEQVTLALEESLQRIIYGLMLWTEGRFQYFPGERVAEDDMRPELELDQLILEGLRRADELQSS